MANCAKCEWKTIVAKKGDKADILFTKVESTAQLVARVCTKRVVMFKVNMVADSFN